MVSLVMPVVRLMITIYRYIYRERYFIKHHESHRMLVDLKCIWVRKLIWAFGNICEGVLCGGTKEGGDCIFQMAVSCQSRVIPRSVGCSSDSL